MPKGGLIPYEKAALAEIDAFKNPNPTLLSRAWDVISKPFESAADLALDNKVGEAIMKAISGIIRLLNDSASWSVRTDAILDEFRKDGHKGVKRLNHIRKLSLEQVDKVVGYLGAKYRTIAAAEGGATGMMGLPGIPIDIPALIAIALRAVNEYATYYGFDVSVEHERKFATSVLGVASSPTLLAKHSALAEITKLSALLAKRATWADLEKVGLVELIKTIAKSLGIRLTKQKLGQIVPLIGLFVGAGVNIWYVSNVVESA